MAIAKYSPVKFLSISTAITILFCLAIAFNISPFLRGPAPYPPEWQWTYSFTNTFSRIWAPILIGGVFIGSVFLFEKKIQNKTLFTLRFLVYIMLLTLLLQFAILYFSRAGIGVLLERVISPGISGYFTTALSIHSIGGFLSTYSVHVSSFPMRAADHPPFAVLFFSLILFVSHALSFLFPFVNKVSLHHSQIASIWNHLQPFEKVAALVSTIVIPLLSVIVLVPLYYFTKLYYDETTARRACYLYSVFPSVSLFLPLNDVFLGLFGLLGFLGILLGQKKKNILYFIFAGLSFVIGAFFSVSLVVPIGIGMVFILLGREKIQQKCRELVGLLCGLITVPVALFLFFHFNTLNVFVEITKLQAKRSYVPWVFYDLYDFFIFSGIPILVCSALMIKEAASGFMRSFPLSGTSFAEASRTFRMTTSNIVYKDKLVVSFFIILFLLDIFGFSRAETGRIWMPYMPFLAVIVAGFLTKTKKLSTAAFTMVLFLQLAQLLVMQEFWVTLW